VSERAIGPLGLSPHATASAAKPTVTTPTAMGWNRRNVAEMDVMESSESIDGKAA
jgi:hypothetical protein